MAEAWSGIDLAVGASRDGEDGVVRVPRCGDPGAGGVGTRNLSERRRRRASVKRNGRHHR
jgi:hypothetical protein